MTSADKERSTGDLALQPGGTGEQRVRVLDEETVSNSAGPLLCLPPHSLRTLMLRFAAHSADDCLGVSASSLAWTLSDLSSHSALSHSSDCRRGDLLCLSEEPSQTTSLHRRSPMLSAILGGIPAVTVATRVACCSSLGSVAAPLEPVFRDSRRGDLYSVPVGRFADVLTDLHAVARDIKLQVEVAVVVVANDVPVIVSDNSSSSSDARSSSYATAETHRPFLLTGKPYARYALLGAVGSEPVQHRVRICFPQPGSFTLYCAVRELAQSSSVGVEEWWSAAGSYVRLVAEHSVE